jgi:ribosomal-protein-serine acetyltransferase
LLWKVIIMTIDLDWLDFRPLTRLDAKEHMDACREGKNYLGNFLGWGNQAPSWDFKDHVIWLEDFITSPQPHKSYVLYLQKRLVGFASFGHGIDDYGVQVCYWVRKKYAGQGLGTVLTEMMIHNAFFVHRMHYVDLHIDQNNLGSLAIPKKLNFNLVDEYTEENPEGVQQSGNMQVWSLENPHGMFRRPKEFIPSRRRFGWSQSSLYQSRLSNRSNQPVQLPT